MKIKEIISNFPEQIKTNKPFVVEIKPQPQNRFTLFIAQQITPLTNIILNDSKLRVQTGFHHGMTENKLKEHNIQVGTVLEIFDLSIWDSVNLQYKGQSPRCYTSGPYAGSLMLHLGESYYRHVTLVVGQGRRDLWIPDQHLLIDGIQYAGKPEKKIEDTIKNYQNEI